MDVTVKLPDDFQQSLEQQILKMASDAFNVVKNESSYPRWMRIEQASKFMNCSRSTLMAKFVPAGLKVIVIDGLQYIDKEDAIAFMQSFKQ